MRQVLAVAVVAAGLFLCAGPAIAATVTLHTIPGQVMRWHSAERYRLTDTVEFYVWVNGKELSGQEVVRRSCKARIYGHGAVVELDGCHAGPVTARIVTLDRDRVKITLRKR